MNKLLIALSILSLSMTACEYEDRAKADLSNLKEATLKINALSPKQPQAWGSTEKTLLEQYFRTVAYWVQLGEANKKPGSVFKLPKNTKCMDLFISKSKWEDLSKYCQSEGFYLCPEEMRRYNLSIERAKKLILECNQVL